LEEYLLLASFLAVLAAFIGITVSAIYQRKNISLLKEGQEHQHKLAVKDLKQTALLKVYDLLSNGTSRESRRTVYNAWNDFQDSKKIETYTETTTMKSVSRVRAEFDLVGALIKHDFVELNDFLKMYLQPVLNSWQALEPIIEHDKGRANYPEYMENFRWLFTEAEKFYKKDDPEKELPTIYRN